MSDISTPFEELSPEEQAEIRLGQELLAKYPKRLQTSATTAADGGLPPGVTLQDGGTSADITQRQDVSPMDWQAMSDNIAEFLAQGEGKEGTETPPSTPVQTPAQEQVASGAPESTVPPPVQSDPTPQPTSESLPPPSGYVFNTFDPHTGAPVSRRYDDATVQQAIAVLEWANDLPAGMPDVIDALLNGQVAAVPRSDLDAFYAWQASKSVPEVPTDSALDLSDPQTKVIQELRQELVNLKAQLQTPAYTPQSQQQFAFDNQQQAQIQAFTDRFYAAAENYAQYRHLTPEEKSQLIDVAIRSEIIPFYTRQESKINPATGRPAVQPDPAVIANKALDYALYQNPQLHAAVLQRLQQTTGQAPTPLQQQTTGQAPTPLQPSTVPTGAIPQPGVPLASVTNIEAKRARAGSLATAPSAAVPHVPQSVTEMSQQQIVEAMAAVIDQAAQAQQA